MKKILSILIFAAILISVISLVSAKELLLDVGGSEIVNHKQVTLQNVGSGGAIVVDVDGKVETITSGGTELVNGIEIHNDETFYEDVKSERSAKIDVTFPEVAELCSNGQKDEETEEEDIDCGGSYCQVCPTCDDEIKNQDESDIDCGGVCEGCPEGKSCDNNDDCIYDDCSSKDICCPKVKNVYCEGGRLISKGINSNECSLGSTCCGDTKCEGEETEDNCPEDCKVEPEKPECGGCLDEKNNCLQIEERASLQYCSKDKILKNQKTENKFCKYNYECINNLCSDGKCVTLQKEIKEEKESGIKKEEISAEEEKEPVSKESRNVFQRILRWITRLF